MFSFSAIINTLKYSMIETISDEELINLLIEDIVKTLSLTNQAGDLLYIDKSAASKIMNNKINVPQKIRGALDKEVTSIEGLGAHIKKVVMPVMIPEKIEGVCKSLSDSIMQSKDVPSLIADEIGKCRDNGDCARLIAIAVRFSFMVPNKFAKINDTNIATVANQITALTPVTEKTIVETDTSIQNGRNSSVELKTPLQRILEYLANPQDWEKSYSLESDVRYYKYAPEYTIEHTYESEDGRGGYEYYLFSQRDSSPHWADIRLKYHQTVLYHVQGVLLDGGRYFTSCPKWGIVHPFYGDQETILYKYLIKDSCDETIHKFYYNINDPEERYAHDKFIDSIIVFSSEEEQKCFSEYADYRWDEYEGRKLELQIPYIEANSEKATAHYENVFRHIRWLQLMYRDFLSMEYSN